MKLRAYVFFSIAAILAVHVHGQTCDTVTTVANVKSFGCVGDGVHDDTSCIATAYACISSGGGVLQFPAGSFKTSGTLVPAPGVTIRGVSDGTVTGYAGAASTGGTMINYTGSGFWLDYDSTSAFAGFGVEDMLIAASSTAASGGGIRIGNTSHTFSESNFRSRFHFSHVSVIGPGATYGGKVGISLTQVADSLFDNVQVSGFETGWINDRTTDNTYINQVVSAFRYGMIAECSVPGGSMLDTYIKPTLLGPVTGTDGYCWKVDGGGITVTGAHYEKDSPSLTAKAFLWFTAQGRGFTSRGGFYEITSGSFTNTMVFDYQSVRNTFTNENAGNASGSMPAISMGTASGPPGDNRHQFIGCNDAMNAAVPSGSDAIVFGPTAANGLMIQGANPGTVPHLTFVPIGGVVDLKLSSAADWRFADAAYLNVNMRLTDAGTMTVRDQVIGLNGVVPGATTFASLSGTAQNGTLMYCSNCTKTTPCAAGGTGAIAKRLNGAWDCN
jgi:hypothetical protein